MLSASGKNQPPKIEISGGKDMKSEISEGKDMKSEIAGGEDTNSHINSLAVLVFK